MEHTLVFRNMNKNLSWFNLLNVGDIVMLNDDGTLTVDKGTVKGIDPNKILGIALTNGALMVKGVDFDTGAQAGFALDVKKRDQFFTEINYYNYHEQYMKDHHIKDDMPDPIKEMADYWFPPHNYNYDAHKDKIADDYFVKEWAEEKKAKETPVDLDEEDTDEKIELGV